MESVKIKPKDKPKWYEFRRRIARWLVSLAQTIQPDCPEVMAFYMQQMTDLMITGGSITRVDPFEFYKDNPANNTGGKE